MVAQRDVQLTAKEYLAWEDEQPIRYGFIEGRVYAMAGESIPHNQLAVNLVALLKPHLRGKCKVLSGDAKVGITEDGPYHYPDVSVTCDKRDRDTIKYIYDAQTAGDEAIELSSVNFVLSFDQLYEDIVVGES